MFVGSSIFGCAARPRTQGFGAFRRLPSVRGLAGLFGRGLAVAVFALILQVLSAATASAACSNSLDFTGKVLNDTVTLDVSTCAEGLRAGLYTTNGFDSQTDAPMTYSTGVGNPSSATLTGSNGAKFLVTPISSDGNLTFSSYSFKITQLATSTTESVNLYYASQSCPVSQSCPYLSSTGNYYAITDTLYTISISNVPLATPAFSSTSLTYGTTIGYNTGSASATSIDVATLGSPTNSPTAYYLGSSGTSTTGTSTNGASLSVTTAGVVSYTPVVGFRGSDTFQIRAHNASGDSPAATVTVTVGNPTLSISLSGSGATAMTALSGYSIATSGGKSPYSCATSVASGALPGGVSIGSNCALSGTPTAAGTFNFTLQVTDSSTGTGGFTQTSGTLSLSVAQASQTITFAQPSDQNFGTTPTLSATASSSLTVAFSSTTTGVCTITSGGALTFLTTGTCTIAADQAGNAVYSAAPQVTRSFAVNAVVPGAPTIGTATAGDTQASVTFTAPASDGGSTINGYTVTSSPGGITGTGTSSPISVTGLTNGTAYTFTVTATNGVGTGAASSASNSVTPKASQTITFAQPSAQNFGTTPTLSATASSGLSVAFTSSTTGVCTITSGGALTFVTAGTCTIAADQAGNGSWLAATQVTRSFTVNAVAPGAPTIGTATAGDAQASVTFTAPASDGGSTISGYTVTSSPGNITGTGSSSPISVTGLTNGTAYTFTVTATNGTATSTASSASNSVTPKGNQTITFAQPSAQSFGTTPTLSASASSGLTVAFTSSTTGVCTITSGGALTFVTAGTCTIAADQAGNTVWNAATQVTRSFAVNAVAPGAPTIGTATAGNTQASVTFTAPASNGGSTISGYTVTSSPGGITGTGTASPITVTGLTNGTAYTFTVTATNGAATGAASAASNSVTPTATQTITFANPGAQNFGTTPTLSASASSGLTVSFSSSTTGVCTITSGGALTFLTTGTCTIAADQAGNAAFTAATQVTQSFAVNAVVPGAPTIGTATAGDTQATVAFTAPASNGGSTINGYTVTSSPGGITGTGSSSPITVTGLTNGTAYTFTVTATNGVGTGAASSASNSVTPRATQTITFAQPSAQTFGTTPTLSASASSGLTVSFTSSTTGVCTITSGGTLTFVTAGTCTIAADQAGNGSWLAATQVTRSFTVNAVAPGAPTIGTATAGDAQASVTFTAPAATGGSAITGYTVTSSPGGLTGTGSASPITVAGLTNGTAYTFTVTATNIGGTGVASSASNSVTPKGNQTITFAQPSAQTFGTTPTLSATASSGLTVSFTSSTTGVCTITSGGTLTFLTLGTCTIAADQAGNAAWNAATQVTRSFAVQASTPVVSSVAPSSGPTSGGTTVTITGTDLLAASAVTFGATPASSFAVVSATSITATAPAGAAGTVDVRVTTLGGTSATGAGDRYTYVAAPIAGAVSATVEPNSTNNPITLSLSGGTATSVAVSTAPTHGSTSVSGTSISYTPTAGYTGSDSFQYTATNVGGTSAPATVTITVNKGAPTITVSSSNASPALGAAVTLTATLSGGVSPTGSVTFKDGATTLATVALSGGSASTTVSSLTLGAHSITAAYAGDANNLAVTSSATTVTVSSRPDPSTDPTVRGIVTSQVTTATRFAQTQIDNTTRRLEEIHDEDDGLDDGTGGSGPGGSGTGTSSSAGSGASGGRVAAARGNGTATADLGGRASSGGTLRMAASDPRPVIDADGTVLAFAPEDGRDRAAMNDAGRAIQKITQAFAVMQKKADLPFRLWTAGSIDFGRLKIDGSYDNHFTTAGLTVGIDGRVMDGLKVGLALGYGQDRTTFGSDGSRSDATAWTATLYGSWKLAPKAFLDVTGGYGTLRFDTRRWSTAGSVMLDGRRDGHEIFGSVGLTFAEKWGALKLSSYGRVDVVKVFLDAYSETGSAVWALAYDRLETTTVSGVAGLRANYTIPVEWGTVTPGVRLEYRHAFEGGFTQRLGYADLGGAGYAITGTPAVRDSLTGGVSLRMMTLDGISIDLEYLLTTDAEVIQNQQVRAAVRVAF